MYTSNFSLKNPSVFVSVTLITLSLTRSSTVALAAQN